ncbi:peptidylprolyl isomerase [Endothiovibrio diazotrophicus]
MIQLSKSLRTRSVSALLLLSALAGGARANADQVLVGVGGETITAAQLEEAIQSSPFATQFVAMDRKSQAGLRGGMLQRLVTSRLLLLEARRLKLDELPAYRDELKEQRLALLYRAYMEGVRERIEIPADEQARLKERYQGEPDALAAAKSAYRSTQYRAFKAVALAHLADKYHLKYEEKNLSPTMAPESVLASGDGIEVRAAEIGAEPGESHEELLLKLRERVEQVLGARAAEEEGIDVSALVDAFAAERLPALLMERKQGEWLADEEALKAYFDAHPDLSRVPERRHVGQIVLKSRAEAEAVRARIVAGENFFELASQLSIDPFGREQKGDMGWLPAGSGMPQIEAAMSGLEDNRVSPVIETPQGFHLVIILERKLGRQMYYEAVKDRVARAVVTERMGPYLKELSGRFPVDWRLPDSAAAK